MSPEEYEKLLDDLRLHGYDASQPIVVFEGAILDGWNRYKACQELDIAYAERFFLGDSVEAINFVMRTNKRRNLTKQQLAALAVESEEIVTALQEATEKERRDKQAESLRQTLVKNNGGVCDKKLSQTPENETQAEMTGAISSEPDNDFPEKEPVIIYDEGYKPKRDEHKNSVVTKLADTFNTNRTYITEAQKLKQVAPEKLKEVAAGKTTFQQIRKTEPQLLQKQQQQSAAVTATKLQAVESDTDAFTEKIATLARGLHSILGELKDATSSVSSECFTNNIRLRDIAPELGEVNFSELINDAQMLKTLKKCFACKAEKEERKNCQWCKQTGYQNRSDYSTTKSALESGGK